MAFERLRRPAGGFDNIARAFSHRNYRIYISGNGISLIGSWLQRVAVGWLAWTLTHSGTWLGLVSLADFLPVLFLSPLAGVLADRRDRVATIRITQLYRLRRRRPCWRSWSSTDSITIEMLFTLVLLLGIASGDRPAGPRLALIPTLVDRESLASALAINSVVFNLARFIGPAIAGMLIADVGIAAAFAANAVSYIAFQISLANLRGSAGRCRSGARRTRCAPRLEAYSYASRHPGIGPMLLLFVGDDDRHPRLYRAVPRLCRPVFDRGPQGLAMLTSTVGLGAICGGTWMVMRPALTGLPTSCWPAPC